MRDFLVLIGQIFGIAVINMLIEMFIDEKKRADYMRVVNMACVMGSLLLLMRFAYNTLLGELTEFANLNLF